MLIHKLIERLDKVKEDIIIGIIASIIVGIIASIIVGIGIGIIAGLLYGILIWISKTKK